MWQHKWDWMVFENNLMLCKVCKKYEERLKTMPGYSSKFVKGSQNFKTIALSDHQSSKTHKEAVVIKLHNEATQRGEQYRPPNVKLSAPANAPIAQGLKLMRETESKGLQKLFEVAFFIAKKDRLLSDFEDLIELEKIHGVSFHGSGYENRNACRDFIMSITQYLFNKDVKEKVERANFIAI